MNDKECDDIIRLIALSLIDDGFYIPNWIDYISKANLQYTPEIVLNKLNIRLLAMKEDINKRFFDKYNNTP
jgi:hypothetical protein